MAEVKRRGLFGMAAAVAVIPSAVVAAPVVEMHPNDIGPTIDELVWHPERGTLTQKVMRNGREHWTSITTMNGKYEDALACLRRLNERDASRG